LTRINEKRMARRESMAKIGEIMATKASASAKQQIKIMHDAARERYGARDGTQA